MNRSASSPPSTDIRLDTSGETAGGSGLDRPPVLRCYFSERAIKLPRNGTIEETPGYCKAEDLANLFALPSQSISQLTRDGILKKRDTPAGKRYNVVESTRAYVQYLRDKAAGRNDSLEREALEVDVRLKQAKAELAELELQELQGWPV